MSSQNPSRDWIYYSQQTVSTEGLSGVAFSPFVPHTVRAAETKNCTDCHVSAAGDNNAWMAQLLLQGTNFLNFLGRFAWVANGKEGMEAVAFAERNEPEAVFGSDLHAIAYPDNFRKHQKDKLELKESYEHAGDILDLQLRGEYVYAAMGKGGLRVFDVRTKIFPNASPPRRFRRSASDSMCPPNMRWPWPPRPPPRSIPLACTSKKTKSSRCICFTAFSTWPTSTKD